ncbi:MAG: SDR family oxidoreductase [Bacteriovoracaceae bacterium]|nr:SDR family oxidoreductase [Bacteriovoracaceae bacterium]
MYKELFDFKDKVVVVCGAGGLIGKELVQCFIEYNAKVVAIDINKIRHENTDVLCLQMDINSEHSVSTALDNIFKKFGRIDSWVNCAYPRTSDWNKSVEESGPEWFNKNTEIHLGGYYLTSRAVLERMKVQGEGSLVNFSSIYGVVGPNFNIYEGLSINNPVAYSAIKAGIINLSKYFATYYGPFNLRVNCVSPGGVFDNQDSVFVKRYSALTPMRRMAKKQEIAGSVLFLSSNAASYITGQNLLIDGGWTAH